MDQRSMTNLGYGVAAVVGAGLLVAASILLFGHGMPGVIDPRRVVGVSITAALAAVWGLVFAVRIFRRQDEFARRGSEFAWYWGGAVGLLATLPVYVFIGLGGLHWLDPAIPTSRALHNAFLLGYGLAVGGLAVGMTVAGLIWWLRHR